MNPTLMAILKWLKPLRRVKQFFACYLIVLILMVFLENSFIYPAPKFPGGDWNTLKYGAEDANFTSADGTKLHGWYFPFEEARGTLLFCHGNGECVGFLGEEMAQLRDQLQLNVFVFDYRGYGRSEGRPHEQGVLSDGRSAHDWLAKRANTKPNEIILMGRSLGGGVAVDLAADRGARGLVLWNTFSSLPDAATKHFPWLPIRWLMRNRYNSLDKIRRYDGPLLQSHGTADQVISFALGEKLFQAAGSRNKSFIAVPNGDHNDPPTPAFSLALGEFIHQLCKSRRSHSRNNSALQ